MFSTILDGLYVKLCGQELGDIKQVVTIDDMARSEQT